MIGEPKTPLKPETGQGDRPLLLALNTAAASLQRSIYDEKQVYEVFSNQVVALGLRGGISLLNEDGTYLVFQVVASPSAMLRAFQHWESQLGLRAKGYQVSLASVSQYRWVIENAKPLYVADTSEVTLQLLKGRLSALVRPMLSLLGNMPGIFAPLVIENRVAGMLNMVGSSLSEADVSAMQAFSNHIGIAVTNARLFANLRSTKDELERAYDATLEGWVQALDLRDHATENHTLRVTELAIALARQVGIEESDLIHMRRGALMHDIGKLAIPDHILRKEGELDEDEWKTMRRHPELAQRWLSSFPYLLPALDIPLYHHERWDGSGYPYGLAGEAIPLQARIFSVVDVWDALSHDRSYRKAWDQSRILTHMQDQSGKHFDPQILKVFLESQSSA